MQKHVINEGDLPEREWPISRLQQLLEVITWKLKELRKQLSLSKQK